MKTFSEKWFGSLRCETILYHDGSDDHIRFTIVGRIGIPHDEAMREALKKAVEQGVEFTVELPLP